MSIPPSIPLLPTLRSQCIRKIIDDTSVSTRGNSALANLPDVLWSAIVAHLHNCIGNFFHLNPISKEEREYLTKLKQETFSENLSRETTLSKARELGKSRCALVTPNITTLTEKPFNLTELNAVTSHYSLKTFVSLLETALKANMQDIIQICYQHLRGDFERAPPDEAYLLLAAAIFLGNIEAIRWFLERLSPEDQEKALSLYLIKDRGPNPSALQVMLPPSEENRSATNNIAYILAHGSLSFDGLMNCLLTAVQDGSEATLLLFEKTTKYYETLSEEQHRVLQENIIPEIFPTILALLVTQENQEVFDCIFNWLKQNLPHDLFKKVMYKALRSLSENLSWLAFGGPITDCDAPCIRMINELTVDDLIRCGLVRDRSVLLPNSLSGFLTNLFLQLLRNKEAPAAAAEPLITHFVDFLELSSVINSHQCSQRLKDGFLKG